MKDFICSLSPAMFGAILFISTAVLLVLMAIGSEIDNGTWGIVLIILAILCFLIIIILLVFMKFYPC